MKDKQIKLGILMTYLMGIVQIIVNLFFTGALVRFLGDIEYGLYLLLGSLAAYVSVFDFGLNNTVSRYIAKYKEENNKRKESNLLCITFLFYTVIAVIILLVGLLLKGHLEIFIYGIKPESMGLARKLFMLLIVNLALTLPMNSFAAILVGYEQFIYNRIISILRVVALPVLSLPLLYWGGGSVAVVLVTTVTNVAAGLFNAVYAFRKFKIKFKIYEFDPGFIKEIMCYSVAVFLGVVADQLFFHTGNVVLGMVNGTADVSVFGVANQLNQYIIAIAAAFSGVYLPRSTKIVLEDPSRERMNAFFVGISRMLSIILIFVLGGYVVLGKEFVHFWLKGKLSDVYGVSLIIMLPNIWTLTRAMGLSILQAKNVHGFRSKLLLVRAGLNVALCFLVAKRYGYYGVAYGYAGLILISNTILDFYYERRVGISVFKYSLSLFPIALSAIAAICCVAVSYLFAGYSLAALLLRGMLYCLLFAVFLYKLYLNDDEKEIIQKYVKRPFQASQKVGGAR